MRAPARMAAVACPACGAARPRPASPHADMASVWAMSGTADAPSSTSAPLTPPPPCTHAHARHLAVTGCALCGPRRSHLEVVRGSAGDRGDAGASSEAGAAPRAAGSSAGGTGTGAHAGGASGGGPTVPAEVAQAALDLVLASAQAPALLAPALPSLAAAGAAVSGIAGLARARQRGAGGALPPPTFVSSAPAQAEDAEVARAEPLGRGPLESTPAPAAPAAVPEAAPAPLSESTPLSPPLLSSQPQPLLSREVAAALAGALEPSARLVEAYAAEITASFQTVQSLAQPGGCEDGGQAPTASGSDGVSARSSRSSGRSACSDGAPSASSDGASGAPASPPSSADPARGGSGTTTAAHFTNWDDALASLPPLPPPPL